MNSTNIIDDNPIYNKDAEQAVIGALLLDNSVIEKLYFLKDEHFYIPISGEIFKKIKKVRENMFAITRDSLIEELCSCKNEEDAQNIRNHIMNCFMSASFAINPEGVARKVVDMHTKRQLIEHSRKTIDDIISRKDEMSEKLIEEAEHRLFLLAQEGTYKKEFEKFDVLSKNAIEKIEHNFKDKREILGLTTGFTDLNSILGGMQKSDLIIIAGRPSMGKTALAINIAINAAVKATQNKESIGFFSLEMSAEQLTNRIFSMKTGINSFSLRSGNIFVDQFGQIMHEYQNLKGLNLFIDDTAGLSITSLRSRARKLARKNNLSAIFVDYLQLLKGTIYSNSMNRTNEIGEITQELKYIAKELNIPVIALSQLSRAVEQRDDKRPLLSDLRESGSIEQDADVVMFIYRDEYYTRRSQPKEGTEDHRLWQEKMNKTMNQAEVIIAKQRNGAIGTIKLFYDSNTTLFRDLF